MLVLVCMTAGIGQLCVVMCRYALYCAVSIDSILVRSRLNHNVPWPIDFFNQPQLANNLKSRHTKFVMRFRDECLRSPGYCVQLILGGEGCRFQRIILMRNVSMVIDWWFLCHWWWLAGSAVTHFCASIKLRMIRLIECIRRSDRKMYPSTFMRMANKIVGWLFLRQFSPSCWG